MKTNAQNFLRYIPFSLIYLSLFACSNCGSSNSVTPTEPQKTITYISDTGSTNTSGAIWRYYQESTGALTYIDKVPLPNIVESWAPDGIRFFSNNVYIADNNGYVWRYLSNNDGVLSYFESIAKPTNNPWMPQNVDIHNITKAYISDNSGAVWVYNISESGGLTYSGESIIAPNPNWKPSWINFSKISNSQYAFISDTNESGTLWQFTISDNGTFTNPQAIFAPNNELSWILWGSIAFNGDYGYVTDNKGHVWQYNINSSGLLIYTKQVSLPTPVTNYTNWSPNNINFRNGYAYIASYYQSDVWYYKLESDGLLSYIGAVSQPGINNFITPAAITFFTPCVNKCPPPQ